MCLTQNETPFIIVKHIKLLTSLGADDLIVSMENCAVHSQQIIYLNTEINDLHFTGHLIFCLSITNLNSSNLDGPIA